MPEAEDDPEFDQNTPYDCSNDVSLSYQISTFTDRRSK